MPTTKHNFRLLLDSYSNSALLPMIKARGIFSGQSQKAALLDALVPAVNDPASVKAAYEAQRPAARVLLQVLREKDGQTTIRELKIGASRLGVTGFDDALYDLMRYALVLYANPAITKHELWRGTAPKSYGYKRPPDIEYQVVAVPPVLELVNTEGTVPDPAYGLETLSKPPEAIREQSPSLLLHGLFTVVRRASERPLTITKTTGSIAKNDLKALGKLLGGEQDWPIFLCSLARQAKLLVASRQELKPGAGNAEFFARPPREQVRVLFEAWLELDDWSEFFRIAGIDTDVTAVRDAHIYSDIPSADDLQRARSFIIETLRRQQPGSWSSLSSLIALIKTENLEFLIPRVRKQRYWYGREADHYSGFWKRGQSPWLGRFAKATDWEQVEGRYIRQVLDEPLRWLGMVETGSDASGEVTAFRLTPLGAHLLGLAPAPVEEEAPRAKPLVVQPNFEIIAYTEPEHLKTLYELERFAERISADRVAHYKLTRDSVYRGLQEGLDANAMREFLTNYSQNALPQNIAYSLDDWSRLFERLTLHRSATLLEAASEAELESVLKKLPEGAATRLAPTWALIDKAQAETARTTLAGIKDTVALDYSLEVSRAFAVDAVPQSATAELQVEVPRQNLDLWLQARLQQFADLAPDSANGTPARFLITRESVARAAALRIKHTEIVDFLATYGTPPLPADVTLTLSGWGGEVRPVALTETVAIVTEPDVMLQIVGVEELRTLLWLKVDERCALVRPEDVPKLQELLARRGIAADAALNTWLRPHKKPRVPQAPSSYLPAHRRVGMATKRSTAKRQVEPHPSEDDVELQHGLTIERQLELLQGAIDNFRCAVLDYQGKVRRALRKIAPLELVEDDSKSYLHAWDFWREDYRVFRLDRVQGLAILEESFDAAEYYY